MGSVTKHWLAGFAALVLALGLAVAHAADSLPSWNDGPAKNAIVEFPSDCPHRLGRRARVRQVVCRLRRHRFRSCTPRSVRSADTSRIGQVIKKGKSVFNLFIEPQYSVAWRGPGQPDWQIFAGFNMQFTH